MLRDANTCHHVQGWLPLLAATVLTASLAPLQLDLLRIFAYGTYTDYLQGTSLPKLDDGQVRLRDQSCGSRWHKAGSIVRRMTLATYGGCIP